MKNVYIVKQRRCGDSDQEDIFATFDNQKADDYVKKFKRLQELYEDFVIGCDGKYRAQIFDFTEISHVWVDTVEIR